MSMTREPDFEVQPSGEAHRLHTEPYLSDILDILEKGVVDAILISDPNNAAQQAHFQGQHADYRSLRTKLKTLAEGKTRRPAKGSVA